MQIIKTGVGPIGIFDSGYGGLSVFRKIKDTLPHYDYIYLGDNARVPYGNRSFETVYNFTKESVFRLFDLGCNLVILACNTASAKALRTIQQNDLPPGKKVLGVIRPTTEIINEYTKSKKVGILATEGTIKSESYPLEISKLHPDIEVYQHACPMWVPLIENGELNTPGTEYYVSKDIETLLSKDEGIDSIFLACTHYPLLMPVIDAIIPQGIKVISQGELVAKSLKDYLTRHPEVEKLCSHTGSTTFYTTDNTEEFDQKGNIFFGEKISSAYIKL